MIRNEREYESAKHALVDAEKALLALKKKLYPLNPEKYYIFSEASIEYINKLRYDINEYLGIVDAEESTIPLWARLKGPHVGEGSIPINLLSSFLSNFKLGIQRIAIYEKTNSIRDIGRPKKEIADRCNYEIKILPGSVRIGFSNPSFFSQKTLEEWEVIEGSVQKAMKLFFQGAFWTANIDEKPIEELFPSFEQRYVVFNQIDKLTPKENEGISSIEFSGNFISKLDGIEPKLLKKIRKIELAPKSKNKIKEAMYKSIPSEKTILEGIIREVDLDKKHFTIRNIPEGTVKGLVETRTEILCKYDEQLTDDVKEGIDKKVKIFGMLFFDDVERAHSVSTESIHIVGDE